MTGEDSGEKDKGLSVRSANRREKGENLNKLELVINQGGKESRVGPTSYVDLVDALDKEENNGLTLEDRKRRCHGLEYMTTMDMNGGLPIVNHTDMGDKQIEAGFSNIDYTTSQQLDLATLKVKASRPL